MAGSPLKRTLRLSLRAAEGALRTTRDLADLGLSVVESAGRVLGGPAERAASAVAYGRPRAAPVPRRPPPPPAVVREPPVVVADPPTAQAPEHIDVEPELVEESADPGAADGAGAEIHIAEPFEGYGALRAPDVIARLRGADAATLAAIELYESSRRRRRTVLDALAREARRPRQ